MVKSKREKRAEKPEAAVRLGKRIRDLRERCSLSQTELAERADMSGKYLGEIERGECNVSFELLGKLADKLGLSVQALVDTEHKRSRQELVDEIIRLAPKLPEKDAEIVFRMMKALTGI